MREIIFRGQTRRYGERVRMDGEKVPSNWVYGGVFQGQGAFSIIYGDEVADVRSEYLGKHAVYTDTLGQYTGLTDKNGTKIFEGDIVEGQDYDEEDGYGIVTWDDGAFWVENNHICGTFCENYDGKNFRVIGNVHDNLELLKGGASDGEVY